MVLFILATKNNFSIGNLIILIKFNYLFLIFNKGIGRHVKKIFINSYSMDKKAYNTSKIKRKNFF
jgi:hypothetical protein